ncbi:MAG TPA: CBS domain-containing protein [Methanomicrobiales archaeon]|jgi:CBS domain-containing protein|nr:CBS domain-containing protein [Methanomicrobiales archaeon]
MKNTATVRDVMARAVSIAKSAFITEALDKMLGERVDPLIVTNNGEVIGTISRRSIAETLGSRRNAQISPTKLHVATHVKDDFTSVYPDQAVELLVPLLQASKVVVVLDENHRLIGKVGYADLLRVMKPRAPLERLLGKAFTIQADERVVHLRRRMLDDGITRFVVTQNGSIVGIVSETDVATSFASFREMVETKHQDARIRNLIVRDIMSAPVIAAEKTVSVTEAADLMLERGISALPITDSGQLAGLLTLEALVKAL